MFNKGILSSAIILLITKNLCASSAIGFAPEQWEVSNPHSTKYYGSGNYQMHNGSTISSTLNSPFPSEEPKKSTGNSSQTFGLSNALYKRVEFIKKLLADFKAKYITSIVFAAENRINSANSPIQDPREKEITMNYLRKHYPDNQPPIVEIPRHQVPQIQTNANVYTAPASQISPNSQIRLDFINQLRQEFEAKKITSMIFAAENRLNSQNSPIQDPQEKEIIMNYLRTNYPDNQPQIVKIPRHQVPQIQMNASVYTAPTSQISPIIKRRVDFINQLRQEFEAKKITSMVFAAENRLNSQNSPIQDPQEKADTLSYIRKHYSDNQPQIVEIHRHQVPQLQTNATVYIAPASQISPIIKRRADFINQLRQEFEAKKITSMVFAAENRLNSQNSPIQDPQEKADILSYIREHYSDNQNPILTSLKQPIPQVRPNFENNNNSDLLRIENQKYGITKRAEKEWTIRGEKIKTLDINGNRYLSFDNIGGAICGIIALSIDPRIEKNKEIIRRSGNYQEVGDLVVPFTIADDVLIPLAHVNNMNVKVFEQQGNNFFSYIDTTQPNDPNHQKGSPILTLLATGEHFSLLVPIKNLDENLIKKGLDQQFLHNNVNNNGSNYYELLNNYLTKHFGEN